MHMPPATDRTPPRTRSAGSLPDPQTPAHTAPTWFVDSDSAEVGALVKEVLAEAGVDRDDQQGAAVVLFTAVRDRIRYNPYDVSIEPEAFRASAVATSESNWCVPKAVLYTAALRHAGVPARLAFADVRNHLTSERLREAMGTDVFVWHGYTELYLDGRWLKASTAFNVELCERFGVKVLDFDGTSDALLHPFDEAGHRHMEYVADRGVYDDLPHEQIITTLIEVYSASMTGLDADADPAFSQGQQHDP